jgi:hypothetical protein
VLSSSSSSEQKKETEHGKTDCGAEQENLWMELWMELWTIDRWYGEGKCWKKEK